MVRLPDALVCRSPRELLVLAFAVYMLLGCHYIQANIGGIGLQIPANIVTWMFVSIFVGAGLAQVAHSRKLILSTFSIFVVCAAFCLFIPLLYDNAAQVSVPRLWALLACVLLYLTFIQFEWSEREFERLLFLCVIALLIKGCWYLIQTYAPFSASPDWRQPWKNILFDRLLSNIQIRNVAGICFVTSFVLSLFLYHHFSRAQKFSIYFLLVNVAVSALCISTLQSRITYIAFAFVALASIVLSLKLNKKKCATWLVIAVTGFSLGTVATQFSQEKQRDLTVDTVLQDDIREPMYHNAWSMIQEKPLWGWGYGRFAPSYIRQYAKNAELYQYPDYPHHVVLTHPHNEVFYWWIEGGIVSVLGILILAMGYFYLLWRSSDAKKLWYALFIVPLTMQMLVEHPFYSYAFCLVLFILFVAALEVNSHKKIIAVALPNIFKTLAVVTPILAIVFFATSLHTAYFHTKYFVTGEQHPELYKKVINPSIWHVDIIDEQRRWRMIRALENRNVLELNDYVAWASEFVDQYPRAHIYPQLALALHALGREEEARAIFSEGQKLYPKYPRLKSYERVARYFSKR